MKLGIWLCLILLAIASDLRAQRVVKVPPMTSGVQFIDQTAGWQFNVVSLNYVITVRNVSSVPQRVTITANRGMKVNGQLGTPFTGPFYSQTYTLPNNISQVCNLTAEGQTGDFCQFAVVGVCSASSCMINWNASNLVSPAGNYAQGDQAVEGASFTIRIDENQGAIVGSIQVSAWNNASAGMRAQSGLGTYSILNGHPF